MEIIQYSLLYENAVFELMKAEGTEWQDYYKEKNSHRYKHALLNSVTYIALENNEVCGFVRCRDDDGFGIYVYDLLVSKKFRGNSIGRLLMERVKKDFHGQQCYVMSDANGYYNKLGYKKIGSIFTVSERK